MTFKEQMQKDLDAIMTTKEFGELVEIEGKTVTAVVEDLSLDYPQQLVEGLRQRRKRVSISSLDAPNTLLIGRVISFKEEEWILENSICEMGMAIITISQEIY